MKVLVTGVTGQVGAALLPRLAGFEVVAVERAQLDLADPDLLSGFIRDTGPDIILNAAAYTAVDRAESERALAMKVNADAPAVLAEEAKRSGSLLVHYSTDYVFDGEKAAPYVENDPTNPLSVYGATKLAGEQAIVASGCRHLILRTSWVYAARGRNFLLTILRAAKERPELRVVNDQFGAPTSADAIADGTLRILKEKAEGVFHMTCAGRTSWHGFAEEIVRCAGLAAAVTPITTAEYPTAARRPRNSVLDNAKLAKTLGWSMPEWRAEARRVLAQATAR
ncbi:MAG TPA: dTDP-4-dehydrorhamnose reductase [Burkholderiales bacterium]|nr:dTDP-4-dehydrorhamnose reductase [Burkholderiales bacterium]